MTTTEIRTTEPTEPGAIAGYAANCPLEDCGMELRSSLRTALELDLEAHARWHEGQGCPGCARDHVDGRCCRCGAAEHLTDAEKRAARFEHEGRRERDAGDDRTFGSGRYGAAPIVRGHKNGILASDAARAVLPTGGTERERQAWANGYDEALQDRRDDELERAARDERAHESRIS